MQPPLPKKSQPEPENKCPDCLYLKLEGIPVNPDSQDSLEFWQISTQRQQINLHLTINFNEQWEPLNKGRVKFGLKGGELRLKLENSEIPYETRELNGSFELSIYLDKQESTGSNAQRDGHIPVINPALNGNGSKTKAPAPVAIGQKPSKTQPSQVSVCHITIKVSEEDPTWVFEEEVNGAVLKGSLKNVKLATLYVLALPCHVEATFEVSKRDVCLTDAEGLWPSDLSRNKRAVLERLILQRLLEPKFQPYLSRAELRYD